MYYKNICLNIFKILYLFLYINPIFFFFLYIINFVKKKKKEKTLVEAFKGTGLLTSLSGNKNDNYFYLYLDI